MFCLSFPILTWKEPGRRQGMGVEEGHGVERLLLATLVTEGKEGKLETPALLGGRAEQKITPRPRHWGL